MKQVFTLIALLLAIFSVSAQPMSQTFNSSGTWVCPAGYKATITVEAWGGGGSGGTNSGRQAGGGGGAYAKKISFLVQPGSYTVTVGVGGVALAGGNSSFASDVIAVGGATTASTSGVTGGVGGAAASCTGDVVFSGGNGGVAGASTNGGGGGGGSATSSAAGGTGGTSASGIGGAGGIGEGSGGKGANTTGTNPAVAGTVPGGGGGGRASSTNIVSASGAAGRVIVTVEIVLSVELSSFSVKTSNFENTLNWSTASEKNNVQFDVQHATNGRDFRTIGTVKGNGTTNAASNYAFEHATPSVGLNYYRLNQVDANGAATLSKVVSVQFGGKKGDLKVYPTLAFDKVTVLTNSDKMEDFSITNLLGQTVLTGRLTNGTDVTISALSKGIYILKVAGETVKFSKQ